MRGLQMLQSNPELVGPRCSICGAAMEPADLIPGLAILARRIFQCVKCDHIELISETRLDPSGVK
jgi:hypothetical protein